MDVGLLASSQDVVIASSLAVVALEVCTDREAVRWPCAIEPIAANAVRPVHSLIDPTSGVLPPSANVSDVMPPGFASGYARIAEQPPALPSMIAIVQPGGTANVPTLFFPIEATSSVPPFVPAMTCVI